MAERIETTGVPDKLIPLYENDTAGGVISLASEMLQSKDSKEQKALLLNPIFSKIVNQALEGSDQYREERFEKVLQNVASENLELARVRFGQVEQD